MKIRTDPKKHKPTVTVWTEHYEKHAKNRHTQTGDFEAIFDTRNGVFFFP